MERAAVMPGYVKAGGMTSVFVKEQFTASSRVKRALGDKTAAQPVFEPKIPTVSLKTARVTALVLAVVFAFAFFTQSARHREMDLAMARYDAEIKEVNMLCGEKADEYAAATASKHICEQAAQKLGMQRAADGTEIHISAPDTRPAHVSVRYIASNR